MTITVRGEAEAWVRISHDDEAGRLLQIGADGTSTAEVEPGEYALVQFKLNAWGEWDSQWGCARQVAVVANDDIAVDMGAMSFYDQGGNLIAGRVYERMGVPAAGIAIVPIDYESGVVGEAIATTDGGGYWEAEIPENGFGGDPWIHDPQWGSVPVLGFPYSDVVLGARITLPKYGYVSDIHDLIVSGPQLREYAGVCLGSQSFEDYETLPGQYRAGEA